MTTSLPLTSIKLVVGRCCNEYLKAKLAGFQFLGNDIALVRRETRLSFELACGSSLVKTQY